MPVSFVHPESSKAAGGYATVPPGGPVSPSIGYSGPQACDAAGITYRQLDYWARTGLAEPSLRAARGSGTQRRYSYSDVLALAVIKRLLDNGMSLQSVRRVVARLSSLDADDLDGKAVVLAAAEAVVVELPAVATLLGSGAEMFHVLPLAGLIDHVDERLDRFDAATAARRSGSNIRPL